VGEANKIQKGHFSLVRLLFRFIGKRGKVHGNVFLRWVTKVTAAHHKNRMKRTLLQIDELQKALWNLRQENPTKRLLLEMDGMEPPKTIRSDPLGDKIADLVSQAFSGCNYKGAIMIMFHVMMKLTDGKFGFSQMDSESSTLFQERVVRYVHALPEDQQFEFARQIYYETKFAVMQISFNRNMLAMRQEKEDEAYSLELLKLINVCVRYHLFMRFGTIESNYMEERRSTIIDNARVPIDCIQSVTSGTQSVYIAVNRMHVVGVGHQMKRTLLIESAYGHNIKPVDLVCKDPRQNTIIKWVVKLSPLESAPSVSSILIMPPLLLRSIMAAEDMFAFFQVHVHSLRKAEKPVVMPRNAVQLIGKYFEAMLRAKIVKYVSTTTNEDYYPHIESPGIYRPNMIYSHSDFDVQTRTQKLLSFKEATTLSQPRNKFINF
jgi:hypothetical protein